jgi:hypothetical protein
MARTKPARTKGDPPDRYALGTEAELAARDDNTYKNPPTHFQQIGPGDRGGNLADPGMVRKDGSMKWTSRP